MFLARFPQSAFLFQVYEMAARASFGLGDYDAGLNYARQSLTLLPENPLLLVSVGDVEAQKHLNNAAIADARDAIEYLDSFAAPGTVPPQSWPELKSKLKATAEFAESRALLEQALALPKGEKRDARLKDCKALLVEAQTLNPSDAEITYLFGLVQLASGDLQSAAGSFAKIYRANGILAAKARDNLQNIYTMLDSHDTFEGFVGQAERQDSVSSKSQIAAAGSPSVQSPSDYAGSSSCRGCHSSVYRQWSQTGMSKMLRPYAPQNVIGDFQNNNEFYLEEESTYREGKMAICQPPKANPVCPHGDSATVDTISTSGSPTANCTPTLWTTRSDQSFSRPTPPGCPAARFMCFRSSTVHCKSAGSITGKLLMAPGVNVAISALGRNLALPPAIKPSAPFAIPAN